MDNYIKMDPDHLQSMKRELHTLREQLAKAIVRAEYWEQMYQEVQMLHQHKDVIKQIMDFKVTPNEPE